MAGKNPYNVTLPHMPSPKFYRQNDFKDSITINLGYLTRKAAVWYHGTIQNSGVSHSVYAKSR
jgi:hypothetical protein